VTNENAGSHSTRILLSIPERKGDYILYNSMRLWWWHITSNSL